MEQQRTTTKKGNECCTCGCLGRRSRRLLASTATNVGICCLLVGYTLLGSVLFLAIEGGGGATPPASARRVARNGSELAARAAAARARTVEHIWDVTVNLNILYRDNWTRLAAAEIARFQDEIMRSAVVVGEPGAHQHQVPTAPVPWTFATSFLYSLTLLTTIGCGRLAPRTPLGKAVTMGYAALGIPLTLLYLSSVGAALSRVARGAFSRALCCCLCSKCGYCCYDERRMADKERRTRRKRQQLELQQRVDAPPPSPSSSSSSSFSSASTSSSPSMRGATLLAPVALCLCVMGAYIGVGAAALFHLEHWPPLDGAYFCFMSLTTIGAGTGTITKSTAAVWFCSAYIIAGMALTAMCFNVVHDELLQRLRHDERRLRRLRRLRKAAATLTSFPDMGDVPP